MRTILFLLQKEFIQIFRNRSMLPILFVLPMVQLLVLVNAATREMKHIKVSIVDQDRSAMSRRLVSKIEASPFFELQLGHTDFLSAHTQLLKGHINLLLVIPHGMEHHLVRREEVKVQVLADAIDSQQAQLGTAYLQQVLASFQHDIVPEWAQPVWVSPVFDYNPSLNYKLYMLPGILTVLVSVIGMFLSAMNVVREKELGTLEQLNVTPLRKWQFVAAKLIPFWIIGLFELLMGLAFGKVVYQVPVEGSLVLLLALGSLYLLGLLGMGLFISTISSSQQQVMFISYFFLLIFILMSGIFTPSENMPEWAQRLNVVNPLYYFMRIMRSVMLKGSQWGDLWHEVTALAYFAVGMVGISVLNYRKTTA